MLPGQRDGGRRRKETQEEERRGEKAKKDKRRRGEQRKKGAGCPRDEEGDGDAWEGAAKDGAMGDG